MDFHPCPSPSSLTSLSLSLKGCLCLALIDCPLIIPLRLFPCFLCAVTIFFLTLGEDGLLAAPRSQKTFYPPQRSSSGAVHEPSILLTAAFRLVQTFSWLLSYGWQLKQWTAWGEYILFSLLIFSSVVWNVASLCIFVDVVNFYHLPSAGGCAGVIMWELEWMFNAVLKVQDRLQLLLLMFDRF